MSEPELGAPGPSTVRLDWQGRVAVVTLSRPEAANALSRALVSELAATFARLEQSNPAPVAVVLTGAGDKAFCAGADLKERIGFSLDETRAFLTELGDLFDLIAEFPRPVIAALSGAAFGGGLELALACDVRVAAAGINLGLPEVRLGIIPGAGGTQRLARIAGVGVAKLLVLTGRRIDAAKAEAFGIVSAVVPAADLLATAVAIGNEIGEGGPLAVTQAKRAIDEGFGLPLGEGLGIERTAYEVALVSEDRNEGLRAFAEKRKPVWRGR